MNQKERHDDNKQNRIDRIKRQFLTVLLSLIVLVTASGCKPSPALREYVYDNRVNRIHETESKELENSPDNSDPDEQIPPERFDQTGTERNRERQDPLLSAEDHPATTDGAAPQPEYSPDAGNTLQGIRVQESTDSGQKGFQVSEGNDTIRQIENDTGSSPGIGNNSGETDEPDGEETEREMVDDNGVETEVPENVDAVTAVGNAAAIVEMLGGGEKLRFTSKSLIQGYFNDIFDISESQALWQGNGTTPLSDQDFQTLLDSNPAACLEINGQATFSASQIQEMEDAGIRYVKLPQITSLSSACQAVEVTAQILGGDEAEEKSEAFRQFCTRLDAFVSSRTASYSPDGINYETGSSDYSLAETKGVLSLYISAWDPSTHYQLHNETIAMEGNGAAVIQTGYWRHPVTAFLSKAGVANASALSENNYSISPNSIKIRYVNPVVNSLYNLSISEGSTGAKYSKEYVYTTTSLANLGEENFKSIIVPDESVRQAILSDSLWQSGQFQTSSGGYNNGYFINSNGNLVETTIHGDYDIYVMPQGAADWNTGSAESVMIPLWTLWKVRGLAERSDFIEFLQEFYSTFYSHALTDAEIRQILSE